jgi:hypothetical protein
MTIPSKGQLSRDPYSVCCYFCVEENDGRYGGLDIIEKIVGFKAI